MSDKWMLFLLWGGGVQCLVSCSLQLIKLSNRNIVILLWLAPSEVSASLVWLIAVKGQFELLVFPEGCALVAVLCNSWWSSCKGALGVTFKCMCRYLFLLVWGYFIEAYFSVFQIEPDSTYVISADNMLEGCFSCVFCTFVVFIYWLL